MLRLLSTLGQRLLYTSQTQRHNLSKTSNESGRTPHRPNETMIFRRSNSVKLLLGLNLFLEVDLAYLCLLRYIDITYTEFVSYFVITISTEPDGSLSSIIKGRTENSKMHSLPPLSFTFNKTTYICYNGLQTLRCCIFHVHQAGCHRPTREERPLRIPPHRFREWST